MGNQIDDGSHWKNTRLCKSLATVNFLVTHIVQNIIFCGQQKKETHFGVNYPFNALATSSSFELGDNIVYNWDFLNRHKSLYASM